MQDLISRTSWDDTLVRASLLGHMLVGVAFSSEILNRQP